MALLDGLALLLVFKENTEVVSGTIGIERNGYLWGAGDDTGGLQVASDAVLVLQFRHSRLRLVIQLFDCFVFLSLVEDQTSRMSLVTLLFAATRKMT